MITLLLTRGLPASGKTTFARAWVAESPTDRARINRDDLRNVFVLLRQGCAPEDSRQGRERERGKLSDQPIRPS